MQQNKLLYTGFLNISKLVENRNKTMQCWKSVWQHCFPKYLKLKEMSKPLF